MADTIERAHLTRPLSALAVGAALAGWPLDFLLYAGRTDVVRALACCRAALVALTLGYLATRERWAWARRHRFVHASLFASTLTLLVAASLRSLDRGDLLIVLGPLLSVVVVALVAGHVVYRGLRREAEQLELLAERTRQLEALSHTHTEHVDAGAAELRLLARRAEQLREDERAAVARELHDELGQLLTGLRIELDMAERVRARGGDVQAEHERLGQLVDATLASTRSILGHLRPRILDDFGLVAALSWLASDTQRRAGIAVHFSSAAEDVDASPEVATCVFRIVQESLTNVLRHARARQVRIELALADDDVVVRVADDGVGLPTGRATRSASMGVLGMRERTRGLGGTFELTSPPEGGVLVTVRLPTRTGAEECA